MSTLLDGWERELEMENKLWGLNNPFLWMGLLEAEASETTDEPIDFKQLQVDWENCGY